MNLNPQYFTTHQHGLDSPLKYWRIAFQMLWPPWRSLFFIRPPTPLPQDLQPLSVGLHGHRQFPVSIAGEHQTLWATRGCVTYGAIWAPRATTRALTGGAHATPPSDGTFREDCNYKSTETDRSGSSFDLMKIMFPLFSDSSVRNDLDFRRRASSFLFGHRNWCWC